MTALFHEDLSGCFGNGSLDEAVYQENLTSLASVLPHIKERKCRQTSALLALAEKTDDLADISVLAEELQKQFDHVVIAGAGGSGLSGKIFAQLQLGKRNIALHFLENIDPDLMDGVLEHINIQRTCFIFISKSGTTVETVSQFYVLLHQVAGDRALSEVANQFIILTTQAENPLRKIAREYDMKVLDHPDDIGGRFSALTAVGLLPAALCGFDIHKIRQGARKIVSQMAQTDDIAQCPGAKGAALHYAAIKAGRHISVMWPYSERLAGFAAWYRQSWAESLGKAGQGSTPLVAMGSTDQHSQLQLFLDGPKDKLFHLFTIRRAGTGASIHAPADLPYLKDKTLGDVMQAQQDATIATLIAHQCPVRVVSLDVLNEEIFGALLMQGTLEIIFMAALLKVNPFDQPAVEDSKILARASLRGGVA